ncbi:MAG: helix-turn-helix transcriptional regulator [Candidatus Aminicenantes bacterium]|nr:helix-turn-helix transcriptional regulator [Candidatus Aminicenantes bacterium]
MVNGFLASLFLAAAVVPVVLAARLNRRQPSSSMLSYLVYLALWNFQTVFTTAFLLYIRYLPKTGRLGFILFNAVLLIPIHAGTAIIFGDFLWEQLGRRLAWTAKTVLATPFLAVLVTYGRQIVLRLAKDPAPSSFQVNAPPSLRIMILIVFALSVAGILISGVGRDSERKKRVVPVAGLTAAGMILGFLLMGGNYSNFLSYILYGFIWLAMNVPALIALAISLERKRLSAAGRGASASRLVEVGERFGLSEREREILGLVYRGRLNKEIARELHISLDTVKKHLYNVFKKTRVRNRIQLFLLVSGEESTAMSGGPAAGGRDRSPD